MDRNVMKLGSYTMVEIWVPMKSAAGCWNR